MRLVRLPLVLAVRAMVALVLAFAVLVGWQLVPSAARSSVERRFCVIPVERKADLSLFRIDSGNACQAKREVPNPPSAFRNGNIVS